VAARSKARNIFARSNTEIVDSNPTRGMDICKRFFWLYVLCRERPCDRTDHPSKVSYQLPCIIHSSRLILMGTGQRALSVKIEEEDYNQFQGIGKENLEMLLCFAMSIYQIVQRFLNSLYSINNNNRFQVIKCRVEINYGRFVVSTIPINVSDKFCKFSYSLKSLLNFF
jgi:hypothetical protein